VSEVTREGSPLVRAKVPATARPMAVKSLLKQSGSYFWSSHMAYVEEHLEG
jgi:hypothetical protein